MNEVVGRNIDPGRPVDIGKTLEDLPARFLQLHLRGHAPDAKVRFATKGDVLPGIAARDVEPVTVQKPTVAPRVPLRGPSRHITSACARIAA